MATGHAYWEIAQNNIDRWNVCPDSHSIIGADLLAVRVTRVSFRRSGGA